MEITFFSLIHFTSFIIFFFFIILVLLKDFNNTLNRITSAYLTCFMLWSAGMFFINNPATTYEQAVLANKIDCFGWIFFPTFFFWFVLVFIGKKNILTKKFLFALFLPAIFFLLLQWQGKLIYTFVKTSYGWSHLWSDSFWTYSFYLYYNVFSLFPIYLLFRYYKQSTSVIKRKQARIIMIFSLIPLIIGSLTNVVLQEFNFHKIPSVADISALIWSIGIVYAMMKYSFLSLTPATAAENIIETMSDALILVDLEGNITAVNKATLRLSEYSEKEIKKIGINNLFMEDNFKEMLLNKALNGTTLNNYNLILITKKKENVPVIFSNSLLKDKENHIVGIVCVAKDITKLKKTEEQLEKRAWELETKIKELEKIQKLTVNREFKMMELKDKNKKLQEELDSLKNKTK